LIKFFELYGITLIHSTPYYPQGNDLAESSNKSLIKIIKKLLEDNKKAWDSKLKFSLWADRVTTKRSLGVYPFQLVYGVESIFPTLLSFLLAKFLQDYQGEPDDMIKRIQQLAREKLLDKS
jgi:transposase InsO family protein